MANFKRHPIFTFITTTNGQHPSILNDRIDNKYPRRSRINLTELSHLLLLEDAEGVIQHRVDESDDSEHTTNNSTHRGDEGGQGLAVLFDDDLGWGEIEGNQDITRDNEGNNNHSPSISSDVNLQFG